MSCSANDQTVTTEAEKNLAVEISEDIRKNKELYQKIQIWIDVIVKRKKQNKINPWNYNCVNISIIIEVDPNMLNIQIWG